MKYFLLLIVLFAIPPAAGAQLDGSKEVAPKLLKQITKETETEAIRFRKTLTDDDWSADRIEFCVDTFTINRIAAKRMDIDFSTMGMNFTVMESIKAFDVLMNKYYNKLLKLLKPADKKILINAQKAWLVFRDAEHKLIGATRKDEYSGGGTIQTNLAVGMYANLVETRTFALFDYFDEIVKEK